MKTQCHAVLIDLCGPCVCSAGSEGPLSPPSQRARSQDASQGELPPMPTSPATDICSPNPQDTSLFSSPRRSGKHTALPQTRCMPRTVVLLMYIIFVVFFF